MINVWDGKEWVELPDLVVDWDTHDPNATVMKYLCKIIGHKWRPSHPHQIYCNRCGMSGYEHYEKEVPHKESSKK